MEEIRSGVKLSACIYLTVCLDEAMRLSPGIGDFLPRETLKDGIIIDGVFFPEGVDLSVPHYSIYHNADYYSKLSVFKLER
jgi:cytochrome P450